MAAWAEWVAWTSEAPAIDLVKNEGPGHAPAFVEPGHSLLRLKCEPAVRVQPKELPMDTRRFGRKIKLPATIAIKHQIRKLMFEEAVKKVEAEARAEAIRGQPREETRPLVHSG